jgi:putative redox protein
MKVHVTHVEGLAFEVENEKGLRYFMDSETKEGRPGKGPKPMEMLLAALAGCTGMDVVSILAKMREPFTSFTIDVEAERADEHPKVFTSIVLTYNFEGLADHEKALKAIRLSQEKYCSVGAMLRKACDYRYRVFFDGIEHDLSADQAGVES